MNIAANPALIWCPFATFDDAREACEQLLHENLIACANILPQVTSVFSWQGEVQVEDEVVALMKTTAVQLDAAIARLDQLHPYETPAIAGWVADAAPPAMRQWLAQTVPQGGAQ